MPGQLNDLRESRFTSASKLCPHPERWTSTDSLSTEIEVSELVGGLVRALQPDLCVETGAGFGQTSEQICAALRRNGQGRLVTIETDRVRRGHVAARLSAYADLVEIVGVKSLEWKPPPGTLIDFVWLDAYHRERGAEFDHLRPFMHPGTIVCSHDTAPGHGASSHPNSDIRSILMNGLRGKVRIVHLPTPRGISIAEVL